MCSSDLEGKRQALCREESRGDGDVDEDLREYEAGEAEHGVALEEHPALEGEAAVVEEP